VSGSESRSTDLLALRIRNLIAAREANTAEANRELQSGDGWLWDHGQRDRELAAEIDALFEKANSAMCLKTANKRLTSSDHHRKQPP
jgi:hypothetical protein